MKDNKRQKIKNEKRNIIKCPEVIKDFNIKDEKKIINGKSDLKLKENLNKPQKSTKSKSTDIFEITYSDFVDEEDNPVKNELTSNDVEFALSSVFSTGVPIGKVNST